MRNELKKPLNNFLKIYEMYLIVIVGSHHLKKIKFKDPALASKLIDQFEYAHNRFILTFVSENVSRANNENKDGQDVAYFYYRILLAYEHFFLNFSSLIAKADDIIFDGIKDLPNHLQAIKSYFKCCIPDINQYPEVNTKIIDQYLLTVESEQENDGYLNPALEFLVPPMPKYRKYALMFGNPALFHPEMSPESHEKLFSIKESLGLKNEKNLLKSYHQELSDLLFSRVPKNDSASEASSAAASASLK